MTRCTYHPDPDDHRLHFIGDPCCVAHGCEPISAPRVPADEPHEIGQDDLDDLLDEQRAWDTGR